MAKERKVVYSLEVVEGAGNKQAFDNTIAGINAATAALKEHTAARKEADRTSSASPGRGGSRAGPAGVSSFAQGIAAATQKMADERREREQSLNDMAKAAEREKTILADRVRANVAASKAIRESARQTLSENYQRRESELFSGGDGGVSGGGSRAGGAIAARDHAAALRRVYTENLKVIDGYRQVGSGIIGATRAAVLFGAANGKSSEEMLKLVVRAEALVSVLQAARNVGGGLLKIIGGVGAGLGGMAATAAGVLALPAAVAGYGIYRDWGKGQARQFTGEEISASRMEVSGRLGDVTQRNLSEFQTLDRFRAEGNRASAMMGVSGGMTAREMAANAAELDRQRKLEAESKRTSAYASRGNSVDSLSQFNNIRAEADAKAVLAATEILTLEKERLSLAERMSREKIDAIDEEIRGAREALKTEEERLRVVRSRTESAAERFANSDPIVQAQAVEIAKKAKVDPNSLTREERLAIAPFAPDFARQQSIDAANKNPEFKSIMDLIQTSTTRDANQPAVISAVTTALQQQIAKLNANRANEQASAEKLMDTIFAAMKAAADNARQLAITEMQNAAEARSHTEGLDRDNKASVKDMSTGF